MTIRKLSICHEVALPADSAGTQTFGVIGQKGAGKSYLAMKLVEEVHRAGTPCLIFDPVGVWWSLRLAADGKASGLSIPVIGGAHADIPINEHGARTIARTLIEKRSSAVIDLSEFRKAERKRFVTAAMEELFHAAKKIRQPSLIVFEEAQLFAPQMSKGEETMVGAMEDIVRLGRNYGLGSVLISQRPQSVNKEVLNQVECLFVGKCSGPHERKAIKSWIVEKGAEDATDKLPALKPGRFYCWSPAWLEYFGPVTILPRDTFDGSATPTLKSEVAPKGLGAIDLAVLREALSAEIALAEADDPKKLRATIRKLEKENADLRSKRALSESRVVEVPVLTDDDRFLLENAEQTISNFRRDIADVWENRVQPAIASVERISTKVAEAKTPQASIVVVNKSPAPKPRASRIGRKDIETDVFVEDATLSKAGRAILTALAQYHPRGRSKAQIGILTGYRHKSGNFNNALSQLRKLGAIEGIDPIGITDIGLALLGNYDPLPTGQALHEYWTNSNTLPLASKRILEVLIADHPSVLTKEFLGEHTGYAPTSGNFNNAVSKLCSLELAHRRDGGLVAAEEFFQ
ncbi:hypothetical protein K8I61_00870 [bacterium]|nr:hypothetical protein [bacterium]